ncbi:thioredoxin family protein [Rhodotorula paludigena]|uniref:Thioredoxin domain-containing protein n=1 Tax=Rhodotorula paludigena TaxID=86838 RepID=A0AAV5GUT8_9BASI|nr:hypothetical protein Rhopal_006742-T1 [Rhodotorula paludigena]
MPVTVIKSEDQYKGIIANQGLSAIQFIAPWDESCKAITPKYKELAANPRWKDVNFYAVDICEQQDVAMDAHVEMAPTFHFYKDGAKVKEYVGSSQPQLERTLGAVINGH